MYNTATAERGYSVEKVETLRDWIDRQQAPRRTTSAEILGVGLSQLNRWERKRAYVIDGQVYIPAKVQSNRKR